MSYAIVMLVDDATAPIIRGMWDVLAQKDAAGQAGFSEDQVRFDYPPHVTAAVVENVTDPAALIKTVQQAVTSWKPTPVHFDCIGFMPRPMGERLPLLLLPNGLKQELAARNEAICNLFPQDAIKPYYKPGLWMPWVTLARDIPRETAARAITACLLHAQWDGGFSGMLDRVAVIEFRPDAKKRWDVKELWRAEM